jgi:hypothetical protein
MLSKEYDTTAQTLRRIAQNMTDQTIVDRLNALAEDYQRRAEKASQVDKASDRSVADVNSKEAGERMPRVAGQPVEEGVTRF